MKKKTKQLEAGVRSNPLSPLQKKNWVCLKLFYRTLKKKWKKEILNSESEALPALASFFFFLNLQVLLLTLDYPPTRDRDYLFDLVWSSLEQAPQNYSSNIFSADQYVGEEAPRPFLICC